MQALHLSMRPTSAARLHVVDPDNGVMTEFVELAAGAAP
jgi:hypothetical protein